MIASGSESPLSEAPSSASPTRSIGTESSAKPTPPFKNTTKKKPQTGSASSSRRSSRIEDRSVSPEKPAASKTSLKFKIIRPPSPEKLSEIAEEAKAEVEVEEKGKRGKKRKSESWTEAEGEVREAIGKGKGKKKFKVFHAEEEEEPKKKNVAIVKKSSGGVGEKSATDMISDLFGDEDEEEEEEVRKDKKEVVKPVIKIKGKSGRKPKIEQDVDRDAEGDVKMDDDDALIERPSKSSKSSGSKSRRHEQEEVKLETEPTVASSKSTSKRTKRDTVNEDPTNHESAAEPTIASSKSTSKKMKRETADDVTIPKEPATEISATKAPKPKGRPKKAVEAEAPPTSTTTSASTIKENKPVEPATAPELDIGPTKDDPKSTLAIEKPKKSFAQVVAGSPPQEKREKKPLPTITKLTKPIGSTPDKRLPSGSGSGTGTNTPTTKKLPPAQKKKEVSLLESTMASLLGGGKPTPKKEVRFISATRRVLICRRRKYRNLHLNQLSKNEQKVLGLMNGSLPLLNSGKYWKVGMRERKRGGRGCHIE
jgi:hypothetical protein